MIPNKRGVQTQKHKQKQSTCKQAEAPSRTKMNCPYEHAHENTQSRTLTHTQTHLPCVSVDWVNQPNFPFFFWVRSASVTPWCYQHAVHTARQQRKQWVRTQHNKRERKVQQETAALQSTVQTLLPCPEKLQKQMYRNILFTLQSDYRTKAQTILS